MGIRTYDTEPQTEEIASVLERLLEEERAIEVDREGDLVVYSVARPRVVILSRGE